MDITAIQSLMVSLKTATDVAKGIFDIKATAEIQGKVIEIQSALLAAQSSALSATTAQFDLQEKVRSLEAQLKSFNDWEAQRDRYLLVAPWRGPAQAYALKKSEAKGEQPHLLCTNCFLSSKRVILNPQSKDAFILLACPSCKSVINSGFRGIGPAQYAEEYLEQG
jgi:hypothetical protein